ncbi:MAG: ribosomal protein S18-alanine N-acetyltransferase [Eubacteriales bacterium]|nr:ribosomal protein S18-alanine N-acetyltransferase [Eubacteriales bacterium]
MFTILKAKKEDIDCIYEIEKENFTSDMWNKKSFYESIDSAYDTFWTYRDEEYKEIYNLNNDIIGYGIIRIIGNEAEILKICIRKECRKKKCAEILLNLMMITCIQKTIQAIHLEVRESNKAAISLYEKHNFVKISERKNYFKEPTENAIIMEKTNYDYEMTEKCSNN